MLLWWLLFHLRPARERSDSMLYNDTTRYFANTATVFHGHWTHNMALSHNTHTHITLLINMPLGAQCARRGLVQLQRQHVANQGCKKAGQPFQRTHLSTWLAAKESNAARRPPALKKPASR
jgi:hypothetical protein